MIYYSIYLDILFLLFEKLFSFLWTPILPCSPLGILFDACPVEKTCVTADENLVFLKPILFRK